MRTLDEQEREKVFGHRFRQWRRSQGITLQEIEDRTGIDTGNLSRMERGILGIGLGRAVNLAVLSGKPLDWFLEDT